MNETKQRRNSATMRQRVILGHLNAISAYVRTLSSLSPRGVYVINLRGHDPEAIRRHLRRCCGPALCCAEEIADMMGDEA